MAPEVSEIEKTIKKNIDEELKRSTAELQDLMAAETQEAVDRINGVYISAINTLRQLKLADAGIFDFFQKTGGNIRVYDELIAFGGSLDIRLPTGVVDPKNSIHLKDKTKYKIIVMAMEMKEESNDNN